MKLPSAKYIQFCLLGLRFLIKMFDFSYKEGFKKEKKWFLSLLVLSPRILDHYLRTFDKNIFGSHNGSNTIEGVDKVSNICIDKMYKFLYNE